eukprot:1194967-Prorocentrum_minimum.AAC.11
MFVRGPAKGDTRAVLYWSRMRVPVCVARLVMPRSAQGSLMAYCSKCLLCATFLHFSTPLWRQPSLSATRLLLLLVIRTLGGVTQEGSAPLSSR